MRKITACQVDQIGKNVGGLGEEKKPCAGQSQKTPVPARSVVVFFASEQWKEQRQPGEKQIPEQKSVAKLPRPDDSRRYQDEADAGGKGQRQHGHRGFASKRQFQ